MQDYEMDAWLGDNKLTAEQYERLRDEVYEIECRYMGEDDDQEREAAMVAALQWILGEITVEETGRRLLDARIAAARALAVARQVARMAALDGMPEAQAARAASIDRMTVRKDLGKR